MLPFLVGVAAGATAVVAVNNSKKIKQTVIDGASKAKDTAIKVKDSVKEKVNCIKSKSEDTKEPDSKEKQ